MKETPTNSRKNAILIAICVLLVSAVAIIGAHWNILSIFQADQPSKQPSEYTWEEFAALDSSSKDAFVESFASMEDFQEWLDRVSPDTDSEVTYPWENGGKHPTAYSYEEYTSLSDDLQQAFQATFATPEDFNSWLNSVNPPVVLPWENGGKQPTDYTWTEFLELSAEQQNAFADTFPNSTAFIAWQDQALRNHDSAALPWENGGKQPSEYTWDEFLALSATAKDAFYLAFDSTEAYNEWLSRVNP